MLTVANALDIIASAARPLPVISCPLNRAAGAVLAENIQLDVDSPPFDRALVDGFAVRARDAVTGSTLRIIGRQDAGGPPAPTVHAGCAVAINTGAPIPAGADAVVMVEETRQVEGNDTLVQMRPTAAKSVRAGDGIGRRGSDMAAGAILLRAGQALGPVQLAVAAVAGKAVVRVVRRPRVAVLVTGDELVEPDQTPGWGQIRNSNGALLEGLVRAAGAELVPLGVSVDDAETLREKLAQGLRQADVAVVSGGMSMGTRDLAPGAWNDLGVQGLIHRVRIKPGKPFFFGVYDADGAVAAGDSHDAPPRAYVAGLPGNPVSALVCFLRFVLPLLKQLGGGPALSTALARGVCPTDLSENGDREFYQPAVTTMLENCQAQVRPLAWKSSSDLFTVSGANALLMHPPNAGPRPAGSLVQFMPLDALAALAGRGLGEASA